MGDDNFFGMPPSDAPPAPEGEAVEEANDGGFTLLGEAPAEADAPFLGDVHEAPPADMGFADDMGFAGAPADAGFASPPDGYEASPDHAFAAPPAEDAPIILGEPAPEDPETVEEELEEPSEPSAMQKWNADWQETLSSRKDEENAMKAEMVEASRLSMEDFQKDRETKREGRMSKNREDEQAKLEAIEADLENDNSWQRVCKMVELSHDGAEDTEDVKRMRDVLILLKNEPLRAASVGA
jgi:hypothetical protein